MRKYIWIISVATSIVTFSLLIPSRAYANAVTSIVISPSTIVGGSNQTIQGTVNISRDAQHLSWSGNVPLTCSPACYAAVPGTVYFAPGVSTATFNITNASIVSSSQSVQVTATFGTSSSAAMTVVPLTISVSVSPGTLVGGSNQTANGMVTFSAPLPGGHTIQLTASPSSQFSFALPYVADGSNSGAFTVSSPSVVSGSQSVTLTATYSVNPSGSTTVTVVPLTISVSVSPGTLVGGSNQTANGMVTFSAPLRGGHSIQLTASPSGQFSSTVPYVADGNTTGAFSISNPISVSTVTPVSLTATYGVNPSGSTAVTVDPKNDPCLPCQNDAQAGEPINLVNGNVWVQHRDYSLPGLGNGITLERTWNSLWRNIRGSLPNAGMFGDSWRSTYEERLTVVNSTAITYSMANGNTWWFFWNPAANAYLVATPQNQHATLTFDTTSALYTLTLADGTQRIFNNPGYLINVVDRNGNATSVTYDSSNRITQVTDAASRSVTFTYSGSSLQANTLQDSTGTIASYTYDGSQRLTRVTYPDGSQYNFAYDANYLLTGVTDAQGKTLETHTYDSSRRGLISARANNVEKVTVSYPSNSSTTLTDSLGNTTTFSYAFYGGAKFVTSVVGPTCSSCGAKTSNASTFDQSGNLITKTDANGNITSYTYDANGNVISRSTPVGDGSTQTWSYTYNSFGEVLTTTDPLNHVTTNAYDALGNLTSVTSPAPGVGINPSTTAFTYYPTGLLHTIRDPLGNVTTFAYYPNGLINTVTDAQNNVTSYAYDARGNRTNVTDANNNPTQYQYDSMNRIKNVSYPDNSTIQFSYDYRGRRTSVTDQNGRVTQYAYDDADRTISVTDAQTPTHSITQYAYDTENNLTSITDALNRLTTLTYDTNRRVSKVTFPSTLFESYAYDADGNLSTKTDRNGHVIQYHYDNLNRLTSKTYPDSSSVNYIYDLASRLTQVTDPTGAYGFAYDNMGRLTGATTQYASLPGQTFSNAYTYDLASNRLSLTAPDGSITTYGYDTLNHLNGMANSWAGSFAFSYDALSRRTQLTRPNGVTTNYNYDSMSRLLSVLHQAGNTTVDGASYTYDPAGKRTSKTNYLNGHTENYGYDPIYQLIQVMQGTSTTETYSYDSVGNRLSSLGVSNYTYNSSNELASTSSGSYTYDANGNTLTDAQSRSFTWDFENRLIQAVMPGQNGGTTSFRYDPFGRRIQKSGPLGTTNYLYDGIDATPNIIEEVDNGGNVLARYAEGDLIDEILSMMRSGAISYYERDALGSVTSLSNPAGALTNTYIYDSFGELTSSTGTVINPFQYAAREFDAETALYNNRARYYDPKIGRFDSEDPVRFKGGIDFYRYTHNDPVNRTDPDGLGASECLKALAEWAKAYANAQGRLSLFIQYADKDPGHVQALEEAKNRLDKATKDVMNKCNCELKAEAAAVAATAAALAARIADALRQLCAEDPEVCFAL